MAMENHKVTKIANISKITVTFLSIPNFKESNTESQGSKREVNIQSSIRDDQALIPPISQPYQ